MLKIYVCGPTVYNDVHIGNIRPILTYDLILKAARNLGIEFSFIHNITDIDDKIINRAIEEKTTEEAISTKYSEYYLDILKDLNVNTITHLEYVTKNLDVIYDLIQKMIDKGSAYKIGTNVWFDVKKNINKYGVVSNQQIDKMKFEDSDHQKHFAADFALWKDTNIGVKYDSPFGLGRPGWHTECVALIYKHFKEEGVDYHGGGMDLTFPHHENENIQFYSVTGNDLSKNWLRTGQININGIKMSKSLQNVILPKDFIKAYSADHLKVIFLLSNLTSEINIDENLLNNASLFLKKIKKIYFEAKLNNNNKNYDEDLFKEAMNHIFNKNFAKFNKLLNDLLKEINKNNSEIYQATIIKIFDSLEFDISKFNYGDFVDTYNQWKTELNNKNFEKSDKLREVLIKNELI
ncbi:class I tRNA ligase family protein [Mycoplasma sp. OR1901]|uniref:class I tRNA ligase family protein n=1 Tax=Mycoplasma sp. OR1901 TaxID=2742195 RepID=UPI00158256D9|nr:class I tRNA ligase family protein [Mycoplasma sp. OR1901]QKT05521.1 class I tRNA ligase family protein [Mycoplasma sp. OR1901]